MRTMKEIESAVRNYVATGNTYSANDAWWDEDDFNAMDKACMRIYDHSYTPDMTEYEKEIKKAINAIATNRTNLEDDIMHVMISGETDSLSKAYTDRQIAMMVEAGKELDAIPEDDDYKFNKVCEQWVDTISQLRYLDF